MSCVVAAMAILRNRRCARLLMIRRASRHGHAEPLADGGDVPLAAQDRLDRAAFPDRKHDDRHPVFPGKREGRRIHDLQVAIERLLVVEAVVALRRSGPSSGSAL